MIPKNGKLGCMFKADPVVRPLEIAMQDILFSPWPLLCQFMLLLHSEEEALDAPFEPPEGGPTQHVICSIALQ